MIHHYTQCLYVYIGIEAFQDVILYLELNAETEALVYAARILGDTIDIQD